MHIANAEETDRVSLGDARERMLHKSSIGLVCMNTYGDTRQRVERLGIIDKAHCLQGIYLRPGREIKRIAV